MSNSTLTDRGLRPRLIALGTAGVLVITAVLAPSSALAMPDAPVPENDAALEQEVAEDEDIGDEQVVLEHGHVDIGPRLIDDAWQMLIRDDSVAPPVWRSPDDMVFHLSDEAIQPSPDHEDFDFLPTEPGHDLYLIPQTQDYGIPWLGWNTQDPHVIEELSRGISLRLHNVEGPGEFQLFLQSGNFDPPDLLWDSTQLGDEDSVPQDIWADNNTHVHANWVFTEPGIYLMDVEVVGELDGGGYGHDRNVLRFSVGDETDPQEGFSAELSYDLQDAAADPVEPPSAADNELDDNGALSMTAVTLLVGAAVVVLGVLALLVTLRSRRARREAESTEPADKEES